MSPHFVTVAPVSDDCAGRAYHLPVHAERSLARTARRTIAKDVNVNPANGEHPKPPVKDPWLRAYRRRYFTQPAEGPGWRAFTLNGALRRARRGSPSVFNKLRRRWELAIAREEQLRRQGSLTLMDRRPHRP